MTDPKPERPKTPVEELRERRHHLAAIAGEEHFPSDQRYDLALGALERTLVHNPGKGVCNLMDALGKLYEYQYLIRNDPSYRHPELMGEIDNDLEMAREALLAIEEKRSLTDRHLHSLAVSLTMAYEYLRRFHEGSDPATNLGLSQDKIRHGIETILSHFTDP